MSPFLAGRGRKLSAPGSTVWAALAAAFAGLLLLIAAPAFAADPTFPTLSGRVVDDAHVLTPAVVSELTERSAGIEKQSGRQLVVVTVPSLQGLEIEDYGYRLGRAWGVGEKGKNTGLILLVAPTERKVRVEVGYGLEGDITDALSSVVVNQKILPRFRAGDIPGGVQAGGDALADLMALPSDQLQQKSAQAAQVRATDQERPRARHGIPIVFVVFIMIWVFSAVFGGRRRYGAGGGGAGSWLPWVILGAMSGRGGRDDDWGGGGGGGGWGGGGGGGGGFSGGGGSFGGGGSSGSW